MAKRYEIFDVAKGIAIILVVLGHCRQTAIEYFVCMIHLPVFLFVSGCFWKESDSDQPISLLKRRIKGLYLPYLLYEVVFFFLRPLFLCISWYDPTQVSFSLNLRFILKELALIFLGAGREQLLGAFWYFISLIFINLIFLIISIINKKFFRGREDIRATIIILITLLSCLLRENIIIPRFEPALLGLALFYCGVLYTKYKDSIQFKLPFFISAACTVLVCKYYGNIAIGNSTITDPPFYIVAGLCAVYSVLYLSFCICQSIKMGGMKRLFIFLGRNTIIVMAFHEIGFKILSTLLYFFTPFGSLGMIDLQAVPVGNTTIPFVFAYFLCSVVFCLAIIQLKNLWQKYLKGK